MIDPMIPRATTLDQITSMPATDDPLSLPDWIEARRVVSLSNEFPNLDTRITSLLERSESPEAFAMSERIFADLLSLLDYLSLIDSILQEGNQLGRVGAIFEDFRVQALSLIEFIELQLVFSDCFTETLKDALDSIAYAMKHDLSRVYESELKVTSGPNSAELDPANLLHSKWVLTNCIQQSIASLAQIFDETITDTSLFDDLQVRREQSLRLCEDLSELITRINYAEEEGQPGYAVQRLAAFREGNMKYLISRDWKECTNLIEELTALIERGVEVRPLLHRLGCYFEALLGQVRTRAVIANPTFEGTYLGRDAAFA